MKRGKKVTQMALALAATAALSGCSILDDPKYQPLGQVADQLDPVEKGLQEYGTMAVSEPVLVSGGSNNFGFTLSNTADSYYTDAKNNINGAAASFNQSSQVTSTGASTQVDVEALAKTVAAAATGGVAGALAAVPSSTPPTINVNVLPTTSSATSALSSSQLAGFQALLNNPSLALEDRSAIITAAGDTATQAMLSYLLGPGVANEFQDKKILLGVCTVSIRPGLWTRQHFSASLAASVTLRYQPIRPSLLQTLADDKVDFTKLDDKLQAGAPLIAVISPMTETQSLQLENSSRAQVEQASKIAAALAGFGANVQAQAFNDWVKQQQKDEATRSGLNVVISYSHSGNVFGYQAIPRLEANETGDQRGNADESLDPISFPALMLIGLDNDDLRIKKNPDLTGPPAVEPVLIFHQTFRWMQWDWNHPWWDLSWFLQLSHYPPSLSETQRLEWAAHLDKARSQLNAYFNKSADSSQVPTAANVLPPSRSLLTVVKTGKRVSPNEPQPQPNTDVSFLEMNLNNRINVLSDELLGSVSWEKLPEQMLEQANATASAKPAAAPAVTDVVPQQIAMTDEALTQQVFILGSGLDQINTKSIQAKTSDPKVSAAVSKIQTIGSTAIQLTVSISNATSPTSIAFELTPAAKPGTPAAAPIYSPPLLISPPQSLPLRMIREVDGADGKSSEIITFPANAPAQAIYNFIHGPGPQSVTSADVKLNLDASGTKRTTSDNGVPSK